MIELVTIIVLFTVLRVLKLLARNKAIRDWLVRVKDKLREKNEQ